MQKGFITPLVIVALATLAIGGSYLAWRNNPQNTQNLSGFSDPYLPIQGGTGTSTAPSDSQILVGQSDGNYGVRTITAGSNITIATSTTALTISSTGGGGGLATSSTWTTGDLVQVTDNGTVNSIATSSLAINTDNLIEGSNLFHTLARVQAVLIGDYNAIFGSATTTDLVVTGTTTTAQLNFDTTAAGTVTEGEIRWNDTYHTLDIGVCNDPDVTLQVGQELHKLVVNKTGSTITNGTPVYITGSQGNRPTVAPTDITGSDSSNFIGMATADIANNAEGCITIGGDVHGLVLNPATYTEGDRIYLSEPAGTFSNVHPATTTNAVVVIGTVTNAHLTQGSIDIAPIPFAIGNNYNGTLRNSIINDSASSSAIAAQTAINNLNEYVSLNILGGGYVGTGDYSGSDTSIFTSGAGEFRIINDGNYDIEFWTDHTGTSNKLSNTEKAVITGLGLFGVGTSSPTAQIAASTTDNIGLVIDQRGTSNIVDFQDGGSSVFNIADGGALTVIGTATLATTTTTDLSIGSLSGFLKATAGHIATALIDLTSDVTGVLPVANGGTGASTLTNLVSSSTINSSGYSSNYVLSASTTAASGLEWISSGGAGTVTSVDMSVPTGLTISGNPITGAGTLALGLDTGYVIPLTASTTEWATAYASTTALSDSYIRGLFSNTATGLTYNSGTGATSLTAGYEIPLTASTTEWATAYGWGDHSLAGYLTGVAWGDITGTLSAQTDLQAALDAKLSTTTAAATYQPIGSYLTGNETITLSGDVTGSGTTSIATTIDKTISPTWTGNHTFSGSTNLATTTITNTNESASVLGLSLIGNRVTPAANDEIYQSFSLDTPDGVTEVARISAISNNGSIPPGMDGILQFSVSNNSGISDELDLSNTSLYPQTSDGLALGGTSNMWSDLFLASGAVVNFNNGDVTLTHSSNLLTLAGGDLTVSGTLSATTIASSSLGSTINGLTEKTTPADADMFGLMDSAASNILKKFSWSSLKTAIQTFLEAATITWTGTHDYSGATVTGIPFEKSWSIASTSPDYLDSTLSTGTTTWQVAHFVATTTLNSIRCESDTGTALVRVGDGTNWTAGVACSATPTRNSSLTNNTFVPEEDYIIEIGTGASSPNWVTVDMELQR